MLGAVKTVGGMLTIEREIEMKNSERFHFVEWFAGALRHVFNETGTDIGNTDFYLIMGVTDQMMIGNKVCGIRVVMMLCMAEYDYELASRYGITNGEEMKAFRDYQDINPFGQ